MNSIGTQIDLLQKKDEEIRRAEKDLKDLKQERAEMEDELLRKFDKADIDGAKGKRGVASVKKAAYPSIKNRKQFIKYVIKNRAWDLFQNRIAPTAYFDRLEEGESVPGVSVFERFRVSIRKRG